MHSAIGPAENLDREAHDAQRAAFPIPPRETEFDVLAADEASLVHAARENNVAAFEQLVRRHDRTLFRVAQQITRNREDSEDVVQEAFLNAYQKIGQFQGKSRFSTWLIRIAVNASLMKLRRRRDRHMVSIDIASERRGDPMPVARELADWGPTPEQLYSRSQWKGILDKALQGLRPGYRTVFFLRDVEGLSIEETAEALDLSVPAVKVRLFRARLQLRERLGPYFRSGARKRNSVWPPAESPTRTTRCDTLSTSSITPTASWPAVPIAAATSHPPPRSGLKRRSRTLSFALTNESLTGQDSARDSSAG
jgi:RNA polymerase sigma-70 factor (ECF subfamily)